MSGVTRVISRHESPSSINKRRPSSPSSRSSSQSPRHSDTLSPETSYNSHDYPTKGHGTTSVRRREANRLAAQRFRSRKKGYQDSLEERIRVLETEKDVLIRQMDDSHGSKPKHRSSSVRQASVDDWTTASRKPKSTSSQRSPSPAPLDADVRIAALESANRRLQDDLRRLTDENEQLRDEARRWKSWKEDGVHSRYGIDEDLNSILISPRKQLRPNLPPLERPVAYPTPSSSSYGSNTYSAPLGQLESNESFSRSTEVTHNIQLPSLRLPPIRVAMSPGGQTLPSPTFTPRFNGPVLDRPPQTNR
ncbi:uncharacterized protein IL334_004972 [Kwoniella shivajii]|uniref:BZIP domain-containing protein n=1 Tax=Kwoniella shivajii TaxID=564305 RepID=A0ABZ1D319_9TREE|nr:hypothetical protein IL334_004972 [Kwoniella shivajii]